MGTFRVENDQLHRDLAAAVRGRRQELGLSQADVGRRARVSRQWVSEFESGKPAAELQLVVRLLDALGLTLSVGDGEADVAAERKSGAGPQNVDLDDLLDRYRRQ